MDIQNSANRFLASLGSLETGADSVAELKSQLASPRQPGEAARAREALAALQAMPADQLDQLDHLLKTGRGATTHVAGTSETQAGTLPATSPTVLGTAHNDFHPSFHLVASQAIKSLNLTAELYVHATTGARHLHLRSEDSNNAFMVAFPTIPEDSTGVAHVLEHTALCGSERYPVRDPFFLMTRRSLSTFMNAMTWSDRTAYPFASQNQQDFQNLLNVYLDATFFPHLSEMDFSQEGIRVEPADLNDPSSPLVFKGVVFNEMKGALSDPTRRTWDELSSHLFPTTTYHYNSGGDPEEIPNLTHEALVAFHEKHYHPSRAVFVTYGNFPLEAHQRIIDQQVLSRFAKEANEPDLQAEERLTAPEVVEGRYPLAESESLADKTHIVLGWLLGSTSDPRERMKASLLGGILLDNSASPLQHALETTELAASPFAYSGADVDGHQASFVCGVSGSNPEHAEAVERLILDVLRDVSENGLPQEQVEAVLQRMEIDQLEPSANQGLDLMYRAVPAMLQGADPIEALDVTPIFAELRQQIRDPEFVKGLARELLDNPHRVRLTMVPDHDMARQMKAREEAKLAAISQNLSPEERTQLVEHARELARRQDAKMDVEVLPKMTLEDVPRTRKIPQGVDKAVLGVPCTWFAAPTNGLVTERVIVQVPELTDEQIELLPIFAHLLTEVGLGEANYLDTQKRQAASVGSLHALLSMESHPDDTKKLGALLRITGTGLTRNQTALTALVRETLMDARFDELDRLRDVVSQMRTSAERSLTGQGHAIAASAAGADLSGAGRLKDQWDGLRYVQTVRHLDEALTDREKLRELSQKLEAIKQELLAAPRQLVVVSEKGEHENLRASLAAEWRSTEKPPGNRAPLTVSVEPKPGEKMWTMSGGVSFVAKTFPTVPQGHPDAPALAVLGAYLRNGYLHGAVREKGGAYGGGAFYRGDAGTFSFYSYRDPRSVETLADFDASVGWLLEGTKDPRFLEEAILTTVSGIDRPGSATDEALAASIKALRGRDAKWRQQYRRAVLDVTFDDLRRVAAKYLQSGTAGITILGSEQQAAKARASGLEVGTL